jgi:hypothetical protein
MLCTWSLRNIRQGSHSYPTYKVRIPAQPQQAGRLDRLRLDRSIGLPSRTAFGLTYYNSEDAELLSTTSASTYSTLANTEVLDQLTSVDFFTFPGGTAE